MTTSLSWRNLFTKHSLSVYYFLHQFSTVRTMFLGIEVDLTHTDYFLFALMKKMLGGQKFT